MTDNIKLNSDRYYKVCPLFKFLSKNSKIFPLTSDLGIDQSIINNYGEHTTKQLITGKPIRFALKLFSIASSAGYLYHAEPYCGSDTKFIEEKFGLGGNVVLSLAQHCGVPKSTIL